MDNLTPGRCLPCSRPAFDSRASSTLCQCSTRRLTVLILLSLGGLPSEPVEAADSCRRGATVIDTPVRSRCTLHNGDRLSVSPGGGIDVTSGAAVSVTHAAPTVIFNAGVITGAVGVAIDDSSGVGKLYNSGIISGSVNALRITDSQLSGQLRNTGTLRAFENGQADAVVTMDRTVLGQGFANIGSIDARGAVTAVAINKSVIIGNLDNSGSMSGGENGLRIVDSKIQGSLRNSGTMDGGDTLTVDGTHISGDLLNSGEMLGPSGLLDSVIDGRLINTGTLRDSVAAMDLRGTTIRGGIYNSGWWYSGEGAWIYGSTLKRFENTGSIGVGDDELRFNGSVIEGDWVNRGSISPRYDGVGGLALDRSAIKGDLINRGALEGGFRGVALRGRNQAKIIGNVLNTGRIVGGTGVYLSDTFIGGDFINSGLIMGNPADYHEGSGMLMTDSRLGGTLRNSGVVSGLVDGIHLSTTVLEGDFNNSGRIIAAQNALTLDASRIEGRWLNSGYIGTDNDASPVDFDPDNTGVTLRDSVIQGTATNRGTVRGNTTGLSISNSQLLGGLVNAGTLHGSSYSLYADAASRLDNLYIAGDNTAHFEGAVYAPATTATLYSNASYRMAANDIWNIKTLINRGTLAVGARILADGGAAGIAGDYVQTPGGVLRIEVRDADHYGRLIVSGTATLPSQARIDVDVSQPRQPISRRSLDSVLSASRLASDGTFAVTSNSALFDFSARQVNEQVDLLLAPKRAGGITSAAREAGLPATTQSAARVLDRQLALGTASTLTPFFISATSNQQIASALTQTLPMDNAPLRANQATLASINHAVKSRLDAVTGLSMGATDTSNTTDTGGAAISGLWSQPFSYRSGAADTTVEGASGTLLGFDLRTSPERRSGWAFAYANGSTGTHQAGRQQSSKLDLWQFLGYSSYTLAPSTEWMLYGGAGRNSVTADRRLAIAGLNGSAKGEYGSVMATLGTSLGHALQLNDSTRLIPSLRLDYSHIRDAAYHEHGSSELAPLLLNVDKRDTDQLVVGVDTQLERSFTPMTRLSLNLGVGYDLINRPLSTTAAFSGAADQHFAVAGDVSNPWLMRGGVAMATRFSNGAEVSLNYDAQQRMDFIDQVASVKASWAF